MTSNPEVACTCVKEKSKEIGLLKIALIGKNGSEKEKDDIRHQVQDECFAQ